MLSFRETTVPLEAEQSPCLPIPVSKRLLTKQESFVGKM